MQQWRRVKYPPVPVLSPALHALIINGTGMECTRTDRYRIGKWRRTGLPRITPAPALHVAIQQHTGEVVACTDHIIRHQWITSMCYFKAIGQCVAIRVRNINPGTGR